jgi:hypothetical protein
MMKCGYKGTSASLFVRSDRERETVWFANLPVVDANLIAHLQIDIIWYSFDGQKK